MKTINALILTLVSGLLLSGVSVSHAATGGPAVYVADFSTRSRETTELTMKLTDEFEIALGGTGRFQLLERRSFDRLRAHTGNEAAIADISGMPADFLQQLKVKNAEMVVFGEVYDDIDSGQVSVTVSFVTFTGEKRFLLNAKIPRGRINDADTRAAAMEDLIKKIVSSSKKVLQTELNGVLFQVTRCRGVDRVVTVDLIVTNNEDDKQFTLNGSETGLFDNNGNRTKSSSCRLANSVNNYQVESDLIAGVPVKVSLEFQGVSSEAEVIARLDVRCWEGIRKNWFTLTFRNLPIDR